MTERDALQMRIDELEGQVAHLTERWRLNDEVDALCEVAIRDRLPIDHGLRLWMPALAKATGASLVFVRTYDETLELHDFVHAVGESDGLPFEPDALAKDLLGASPITRRAESLTLLAQALDVAGDPFGAVAVLLPEELDEEAARLRHELVSTWCEEIDNHLASIADARKKANLTSEISHALQDPVLERGLSRALEVLQANVPFDDLVLVFRHEDDVSGDTLRYKIIKGGVVVHDSASQAASGVGSDVDTFMRSRAFRIMAGDDEEMRERFGIQRYREEVLITGVKSAKVIGRMVVTSRHGEFNTFDRDLIDRFADSLRQRVVDFNREWKNLAVTFSSKTTERLLQEEGYVERYLSARERECAVMFCDIAGFTRLSEQVLGKPEAIGRLIDTWSARAVQIVWESGGTFDKMVGDCVIAIWGPPFFDEPAEVFAPPGGARRARHPRVHPLPRLARGLARAGGRGDRRRDRLEPLPADGRLLRARPGLHRLLLGDEQHGAIAGAGQGRRDPLHGELRRPRAHARRVRRFERGEREERQESAGVSAADRREQDRSGAGLVSVLLSKDRSLEMPRDALERGSGL